MSYKLYFSNDATEELILIENDDISENSISVGSLSF